MVISHFAVVRRGLVTRDHIPFATQDIQTPEQMYTALGCQYPKFYKMDTLCKWAFVTAEYLLGEKGTLYHGIDKFKIAVTLSTSHGCLDVDKRFAETMSMPSPALFVYTLPNIMLGEICIRHGFKGEQLCMVSEGFDAGELYFNVQRLLTNTDISACLCGWAEAADGGYNLGLFWVTKGGKGAAFSAANMLQLYQGAK